MRTDRRNGGPGTEGRERAVIAALRLPSQRRWEVEESLDELEALALAAGASVVHRVVQERKLDVENIMQTWFLSRSDFQVPYSILEEKVRLAAAKDASR